VLGVKVWIYKGEIFDLYGTEGESKRGQAAAS
jgi:ribosomal protein S3